MSCICPTSNMLSIRNPGFVAAISLAVVVWLGVGGASPTFGQTGLSSVEKAKLGPRLQPLLDMQKSGPSPAAQALAARPFREGRGLHKSGGEATYAVFVHASGAEALRDTGAEVDSRFSGFVTARATPSELRSLAALESVSQIRAAPRAKLHNDEAAAFVGARPLNNGYVEGIEYSGEGVLGCVIDTGIDYDHPDFVDDEGNSRILSIWDQTFDTDGQTPHDRHPSLFSDQGAFDYGTEYHRPEIENGGLQTEDTNGHGTHVAGTVGANGNADSAGKYKGMAPGVEFVIIKAGNGGLPATNWINGLNFCDKIAEKEGMPMVANMSLGGHSGPHDGTSARAEAVNQIVDSGDAQGRAVTVAAGNEGKLPIHMSTTVPSGGNETIEVNVPAYAPKSGNANDVIGAQLWLGSDQNVTATVTTPGGTSLAVGPGETADTTTSSEGAFTVANDTYVGNGDRYIQLIASDPAENNVPSSGTWTIELSNGSSSSLAVDGWLGHHTIGQGPSLITYAQGNAHSTVGIPGTATHAITTGSFMHRWRWHGSDGETRRRPASTNRSGDISLFSSEGPRRDGTQEAHKPEITAPGQNVISSLSQDASVPPGAEVPTGLHQSLQGTSMAAPVVAGSIALLLEEDPTLTSSEIKGLLTTTADSDSFTGTVPNDHWGYGRLDVLEAMVQLRNPSGSASFSIVPYGLHPDSTYEGYFKLGGDGGDAHAIRFQPSNESRLSGAYFHLYNAPANYLTDSLVVELRSDGGGVPGAQIGNEVKVAPSELRPGTWSYQSLFDTDVQLTGGETYYLVFFPEAPSDALYLMGENYDASGNTLYLSSGTWQEDPNFDLLVRPVVTRLTGADFLPVELAGLEARASGQSVRLQWQTASETENARFVVQHKGPGGQNNETGQGAWGTLGSVEGAGTTTEPQSYDFTAEELTYGTHRFRLRQVDIDGTTHHSRVVKATLSPPGGLAVEAFPNPIKTQGTLRIATQAHQEVTLTAYDVLGRRVARLFEGEVRPGRPASIKVKATSLPSGTYFLRVRGETATETARLTVVR